MWTEDERWRGLSPDEVAEIFARKTERIADWFGAPVVVIIQSADGPLVVGQAKSHVPRLLRHVADLLESPPRYQPSTSGSGGQ